jgi:heme-degrading monooxygenase HmoA
MFCVLFEVRPRAGQWDNYFGAARQLRPELERIDGFVDNTRYRSLGREGWLLSVSTWRDEAALVRWRMHPRHRAMQERGRAEVFADYHLRVGALTRDSSRPGGEPIAQPRLDETKVGAGTTVVLVDAPGARFTSSSTEQIADALGLRAGAEDLVDHDVFESVLPPASVILVSTWRDAPATEAFVRSVEAQPGARVRSVRVVRDYGMRDRREAPPR